MIVSIEGNIGSGKSTLLAFLKKHFNNNPNIVFLKEPVDDWESIRDENDKSIIEKFYGDQEKYSFSFQMMAYISRLAILKETFEKNPNAIIITERSLHTDKMVFARMLFDSNKIEVVNYKIYLKWFNVFAKDYNVEKIVYVCADPKICLKRIVTRSRMGEEHIPLSYLESCHEYHTKMLDTSSDECVCNDQLVLDGCLDIYENENVLSDWIKKIEEFIMNQ